MNRKQTNASLSRWLRIEMCILKQDAFNRFKDWKDPGGENGTEKAIRIQITNLVETAFEPFWCLLSAVDSTFRVESIWASREIRAMGEAGRV